MPPLYEKEKIEKPKNLKDVPRFFKELLGGFFYRYVYILKLVWSTGKWIPIVLGLIAVAEGVLPVVGSIISKNVINELQRVIIGGTIDQNDFFRSAVPMMLVFLFVYRIFSKVLSSINSAVMRASSEKVVKQVKLMIMNKSKEIDLQSFDNPEFYEKMENANREAGMRPLNILSGTFSIVSSLIALVSYLIILLSAPGLQLMSAAILIISVPSAIINYVYRNKNFKYLRYRSKERRQMNYFSEVLVGKDIVKEVRVFDLADSFIDRYLTVFKNYYAGIRRLILTESIWQVSISVTSAMVNVIFYFIIAYQVFKGSIMIGDYTLYTGAISSVASYVTSLISTSATIYEGTLFIDNLISFMKEKKTIAPIGEPQIVSRGGHTVEFRDVCFKYPGTERLVIKNMSFKIDAGETVVLVGLNGAGKTTLIKLLTRLYDPTSGEILLDGKDIKCYDLASLYKIFGIIFQDFGKYAVTVEENISFGDIHRDIDRDRVVFAANQSSAAKYIESLPEGYDTPLMRVFERTGTELSIGQWQKIAVSRAFYADSDILILDEPTASLDALAEQEIFSQFDKLREYKTTIFVSHRLSSATVADKIFVLEKGELIEEGNHRELMNKKGKYFELFSTQAKRYLEQNEQNGEMPGHEHHRRRKE